MVAEQISRKPRVLVADDDQSIRHLICKIVQREKFAVDCVADGLEAVEKLKEHEYALILLDLMMPRLDGFGVVQYLKENAPLHKPIVLIISAYADQRFREVDPTVVAGVLRKPFEVSEVGNLVRMCVAGYEIALRKMTLTGDAPNQLMN